MSKVSYKYLDNTLKKAKGLEEIISAGEVITKSVAEDLEENDEGKTAVEELRIVMVEYARMKRELKQYVEAAEFAKKKYTRNHMSNR